MEQEIFNKKKSIEVKGLAVIFMFWLHLYGHPETLSDDVRFTSLFLGENTIIIEWFIELSSICVPIFLFIAGYAFSISLKNKNFSIISLVKKLYLKYWIVFVVLIPVCILLGAIQFDLKEFLLNFFAITSSYCGEWWFFSTYIELSICAYFLSKTKVFRRPIILGACSVFLLVVGYTWKFFGGYLIADSILFNEIYLLLVKQPIYLCGYICNEYNILEKIQKMLGGYKLVLSVFVWLLVFTPLPEAVFSVIILPILITTFCTIRLPEIIRRCLEFLGKYSTYLWLIHGVLIYKIAQKIIYYFHVSIINLIVLFLVTIPIALVFQKIEVKIFSKRI